MLSPVKKPQDRTMIYSIPVSGDLDAQVRRRLRRGRFKSLSEYVRAAIRAELDRADKGPLARGRGQTEIDMRTEVDIAEYTLNASRKAAELLGLEDVDWLSHEEVLDRIGRSDGQAYDRLRTMLERYAEWRRFHGRVELHGNAGRLSTGEHDELIRLQSELDCARRELVTVLRG